MFSVAAASVLLLAGTVLAEPLATITPCAVGNAWNVSHAPITVTSQYQPVSTCAPTTVCGKRGLCKTSYPFETFKYVSTVIPCAFNSSGGSSTTVTTTDQLVTVSHFRTTLTSFSTVKGHRHAKPTPVYTTIGQDYVLPYNEIGPLAIPGWGGSGLCTNCGADFNGVRHQPLPVTECTAGPAGTKCVEYTKTLVSTPAPSATSATAAACSTSFTAPSAGTYTFTFPYTAPARTITAEGQTFTVEPYPFNIIASRFFAHDGPWNFATTVTTTITQTVPASTAPPTATHDAPVPEFWEHPPWNRPPFEDHPPFGDHSPFGEQPPSSSSSGPSPSSTSNPWTSPSSGSSDDGAWLEWSSSSGSSPSTSSSPATSTWSSSTITTTATTAAAAPTLGSLPPSATEIYVTANIANARYRKRAIDYLSFTAGGDGVLVSSVSAASKFYLTNGYLLDAVTGEYVGTDDTSGNAAFEEFADAADASGNWSLSGGDLSFGAASFCYTTDNSIFFVFPGATGPSGCTTIDLGTASVSSTSTSTTTTTTPSSPQPSSDLTDRELESQEKEVEQEEVVNKRAVRKRHGLLHKH